MRKALFYIIAIAVGVVVIGLFLIGLLVVSLLLVFILASVPLICSYKVKNEIAGDFLERAPFILIGAMMIAGIVYPSFSALNTYFNGTVMVGKVHSNFTVYLPGNAHVPGHIMPYSRVLVEGKVIEASNPGEFEIGTTINVLINRKNNHLIAYEKGSPFTAAILGGSGTLLFSTLGGIFLTFGTFILWIWYLTRQYIAAITVRIKEKPNTNAEHSKRKEWLLEIVFLTLTYVGLIPVILILLKSIYIGIYNNILGTAMVWSVICTVLYLNVFERLFECTGQIMTGGSKIVTNIVDIISALLKVSIVTSFVSASAVTLLHRKLSFLESIKMIYCFVIDLLF